MTFAEEMRQEGREEGRQEGREEGREEGVEKVAINMLKLKISDSIIAQSTGLPLERIAQLKQKD